VGCLSKKDNLMKSIAKKEKDFAASFVNSERTDRFHIFYIRAHFNSFAIIFMDLPLDW